MSGKNEMVTDAVEMIRAAGFEPSVTRGRHYKVRWLDPHGTLQCLVVSFSPGDQRAQRNSRSVLKRLLTAPGRMPGNQKELTT